MKIQLRHNFEDIVSVDNLLLAWKEFIKGKTSRKDVQEFGHNLMSNIFSLHNDLVHLCFPPLSRHQTSLFKIDIGSISL